VPETVKAPVVPKPVTPRLSGIVEFAGIFTTAFTAVPFVSFVALDVAVPGEMAENVIVMASAVL
jgi:hypothetical protein